MRELIIDENTVELVIDVDKLKDVYIEGRAQMSGGRIIVTDPENGGPPATLQAIFPVVLKVNGRIVREECVVNSNDVIEWEIEQSPMFTVEVSRDAMEAYFHLRSKKRFAWKLIDRAGSRQQYVEAVQDKETVLHELKIEEVLAAVLETGIKQNIDYSKIINEMSDPTFEAVVVAKGQAAIPGEDAKLELYFNNSIERGYEERLGKIDFREQLKIPSIRAGDVIAKIIPPVDGKCGTDLFLNPLIPPQPRSIEVVQNGNVTVTERGEVIALKEGRPSMTGTSRVIFQITGSYIVPGNVDMVTGNIHFSGDVIVYGNVCDGMKIESFANVYIYGNAYRATIIAKGDIYIAGNVVGSKVYSGYYGKQFMLLCQKLRILAEQLNELHTACRILMNRVKQNGQTVRAGQVVMLLLESKYSKLLPLLRDITQCFHRDMLQSLSSYQDFIAKIRNLNQVLRTCEINSIHFFHEAAEYILSQIQIVEGMQQGETIVEFGQCYVSEIYGSGNIVINREGVIQSKLHSRKDIVFRNAGAVCRGTVLDAGRSIEAMTVGTESGGGCILQAKKKIRVRKMYGGQLTVGRKILKVYSETKDIEIIET